MRISGFGSAPVTFWHWNLGVSLVFSMLRCHPPIGNSSGANGNIGRLAAIASVQAVSISMRFLLALD